MRTVGFGYEKFTYNGLNQLIKFEDEINPSANDTNPFRYCGEYYDEETGSIYLRARYYNPTIGRFTAEDPIKDGFNWYAYCGGGNPVTFWDPLGLRSKSVPLRETIENAGGTVAWDSNSSKATVNVNGYSRQFYVGDGNETKFVEGELWTNNIALDNMIYAPIGDAGNIYEANDDLGKLILRTWLNGDGSKLELYNDMYSDQIMNNQYVRIRVGDCINEAINNGTFKINYEGWSDLTGGKGGGYGSGYDLINGSNSNVGGFKVRGSVNINDDGYTAYLYIEFNDIIDPNNKYRRDMLYSLLANSEGYECNDYDLKISGNYVITNQGGL